MIYGSYRGLRGGSFNYNANYLRAANRYSTYVTPMSQLSDIGFRVSEVPEPATTVMLALASVGILRRKKA